MKYLLALFTAAVLIAGCKDSPSDPESDYPYRIGTWQINSPDQARWVGQQAQKQSAARDVVQDTTITLETPQGQNITITDTAGDGKFKFEYTDSTQFNWQQFDLNKTETEFPRYADGTGAMSPGSNYGFSIDSQSLYIFFNTQWPCGQELENNPLIWIHFYSDDGTPRRNYRIKVDGFAGTLDSIAC